MEDNNFVIVFDNTCGICNKWAQLILKWDKKKKIKFASLKSQFAQNIHQAHPTLSDFDTIIYFSNNEFWIKSGAILKIFKDLGGLYQLFGVFKIVPLWIRDALYDVVASHRYQIFGKDKTCQILTDQNKNRFID